MEVLVAYVLTPISVGDEPLVLIKARSALVFLLLTSYSASQKLSASLLTSRHILTSHTMPMPTRTIAGQPVGEIGFGLMNFTWRPTQTPDEQAFEAIKTAVDLGSTFLNCE